MPINLAQVNNLMRKIYQEEQLIQFQDMMRSLNRRWGEDPIYGPFNYDPRPIYGPPLPPPEFQVYDEFYCWVGIGFWDLKFHLFWDDSNCDASQILTREQWEALRDFITDNILKDEWEED